MISKQKAAEEVANRARRLISDYCLNECHAYCCRKGHLPVNSEEKQLIDPDDTSNSKTSINLNLGGCPQLDKNNYCKIHKNPKRPETCHKFPIFIDTRNQEQITFHISNRCPAKRDNKFYPFIHEFLQLGLKEKRA